MAKAKRVHSTSRKTAPAILAVSLDKPALDNPTVSRMCPPCAAAVSALAFRRLESGVNDLQRFASLLDLMVHQSAENPDDEQGTVYVMLLSEVLLDRMQAFKASYYAAYKAGG